VVIGEYKEDTAGLPPALEMLPEQRVSDMKKSTKFIYLFFLVVGILIIILSVTGLILIEKNHHDKLYACLATGAVIATIGAIEVEEHK